MTEGALTKVLAVERKEGVYVGFAQFDPEFGNKNRNLAVIAELVKRAKRASLLVLPELCTTGYVFKSIDELRALAEPVPEGRTVRFLSKLAREHNTYIVCGIAEREGDAFYNSAVLVGPEGFVGLYRKSHLFWNEKKFFEKGSTGFQVFELPFANVGIMICFDWIFPEAARTLALKGADVIAHPVNLVFPYAFTAAKTRAVENKVYVIMCNRTGKERGLLFRGGSLIVSPKMRVLARARRKRCVATVKINVEESRDKSITPLNDIFKDRRTDLYFR